MGRQLRNLPQAIYQHSRAHLQDSEMQLIGSSVATMLCCVAHGLARYWRLIARACWGCWICFDTVWTAQQLARSKQYQAVWIESLKCSTLNSYLLPWIGCSGDLQPVGPRKSFSVSTSYHEVRLQRLTTCWPSCPVARCIEAKLGRSLRSSSISMSIRLLTAMYSYLQLIYAYLFVKGTSLWGYGTSLCIGYVWTTYGLCLIKGSI